MKRPANSQSRTSTQNDAPERLSVSHILPLRCLLIPGSDPLLPTVTAANLTLVLLEGCDL